MQTCSSIDAFHEEQHIFTCLIPTDIYRHHTPISLQTLLEIYHAVSYVLFCKSDGKVQCAGLDDYLSSFPALHF